MISGYSDERVLRTNFTDTYKLKQTALKPRSLNTSVLGINNKTIL